MEFLRRSPVTVILLGMNLMFFITEEILQFRFGSSLFPNLALSVEGLKEGSWWQLVTHAFLHANLFHLLVNMIALWFTGPLLEQLLGGWRYLILYFGGIVAGGVLQVFGETTSSDLVGASGAVCALLVGFATLLPRLQITALLFFLIPVRMKAATLGWLVILGSLLFWLLGIERGIGHLAHLGGGIAGFVICQVYRQLGLVRVPPEISSSILPSGR